MFADRVLSRRLDEVDDVGIVTVCDNTGFWYFFGEQFLRPRPCSSISQPSLCAFAGQAVNEDDA